MTKSLTFGLDKSVTFWLNSKEKLKLLIPNNLSFVKDFKRAKDETHRVDFLDDFFPIDIFSWNISSNVGLKKSFKMLLDFKKFSFVKKRIILKVFLLIFNFFFFVPRGLKFFIIICILFSISRFFLTPDVMSRVVS